MAEVDRKPTWQSGGKPKSHKRGRPRGRRIVVTPSEQIIALVLRFNLKGDILTFRDVARELEKLTGKRFGLGTLYNLSKGIEPKRPAIRAALGLPARVEVACCPRCGQPPLSKRHRCAGDPPKPRLRRWDWRGLSLTLAGLLSNGKFMID